MPRRGFGRDERQPVSTRDRSFQEAATQQLGPVFTLRPTAKYMTGARTILKINGNIIGFAFQVSWNIQTDATEIMTIDEPIAYELAPRRISVSGTLGLFQVPNRSPQAELIQSDVASFVGNKYITIEVRDSNTDAILFKTNRAMIVGQQSDIRSEGIAQTTLQWKAIGWQAESSPNDMSEQYDSDNSPSSSSGIQRIGNAIKEKFSF